MTCFCISFPSSNRIILNVMFSLGLYFSAFSPEMSIENCCADTNAIEKRISENVMSNFLFAFISCLILDSI